MVDKEFKLTRFFWESNQSKAINLIELLVHDDNFIKKLTEWVMESATIKGELEYNIQSLLEEIEDELINYKKEMEALSHADSFNDNTPYGDSGVA